MRRHLRNPWVWIAALLLFALWLLWPRPVSSPPRTNGQALPPAAPTPAVAMPPSLPAPLQVPPA